MKKILLAFDRELVIAEKSSSGWSVSSQFKGANPITVAYDPTNPERIYCGTFDRGLWRSTDGGASWEAIGMLPTFGDVFPADTPAIRSVTALTVSSQTGKDGHGIIYVGTEPSALFVSKNGGESFDLLTNYEQIPSRDSWFFPQREYTHHVKYIEIDCTNPETIYTTIEVGGLIKSVDGGKTWSEYKEGNYARDIHVLKSHKEVPNRLYAVLGDSFLKEPGHGYAESDDGGKTWEYLADGLKHHYAYHMAVNPTDPDNVIIATAADPHVAHMYEGGQCESIIYRKAANGAWEEVTSGLPDSKGTLIPVLKSAQEDQFYLFSNKGVFYSSDKGANWSSVEIPWEPRFMEQHPYDMLVMDSCKSSSS